MRRPYSTALALRIATSFRFCFSADMGIHPQRFQIPMLRKAMLGKARKKGTREVRRTPFQSLDSLSNQALGSGYAHEIDA
jgi:hypothetical protein